jgi:hypothetical protein
VGDHQRLQDAVVDLERAALVGDRRADDRSHALRNRNLVVAELVRFGRMGADDAVGPVAAARDAHRKAGTHAGFEQLRRDYEPVLARHVRDHHRLGRFERERDMAALDRIDRRAGDAVAPADPGTEAQEVVSRTELEHGDVFHAEVADQQRDGVVHHAHRVGALEGAPRELSQVAGHCSTLPARG